MKKRVKKLISHKELNEHSKDDIEERSMVKSAIKEIYQLFS